MKNNVNTRILVLDDEPFMLKLLARMLANLGFTSVSTCDNGRDALTLIDLIQTPTDLILMDVNMPNMDGVEFVRHLVAHHYGGSLILVSGENERVLQSVEKLIRAHKINVLGHLNKPVTPERLSLLIDRFVPVSNSITKPIKKIYSKDALVAAIDNSELVNHYQPKVAVASGEVVGVETLVRWHHPEDGLVFPDQFIGIAEQFGLIEKLTQAVLSEALPQAREWLNAGYHMKLAVNLSMDNLVSLSFLDYVVNLAAQANVPPQQLVLEVTESRLMLDQRVSLEILTRLRLKRFRLSIDDFGTGNSSLAQLRDIPFDELKIDKSFVHGAWDNDTQRAMFDASVGLAKELNMETVAEGVEDRADWNFLREHGCDVAQGYFIAKPMPAKDLPDWLADWEERRGHLIGALAQ